MDHRHRRGTSTPNHVRLPEDKNCRTTNNDQVAHLAGGGVNVNEANAVSLSDELSNPATVIVH